VIAIEPGRGLRIDGFSRSFSRVDMLAMAIGEHLDWPDSPEFTALLRVLQVSWPNPVTLTCETVGIDDQPESRQNFLRSIQALADGGLLQFEALLVGATRGPEVVDAILTARGRALLGLK
jgi:hypothetical protein